MKDTPRHAPRRRICYAMLCYAMPCPAMPCNATISNTKDKEVKFIKDTLMQKAYELSLWKIRDGDDAQSAISTGYHSQVRERERERKRRERERGERNRYISNPNPNPNPIRVHQARTKCLQM